MACPITKIMKVLGMKWNLLILKELNMVYLKKEKIRYNELLKNLKPISSRTLSKRLSQLEKTGLIKKEKKKELPPKVYYSLTKSGRELIKCFSSLNKWAEKYNL